MAENSKTLEELRIIANELTEEDFLTLSSLESGDAERLFSFYAAVKGFTIRKHDQRRRRSGEIVMHKWVCSRQGQLRRPPDTTDVRRSKRGTIRIGCLASFKIVSADVDSWAVSEVVLVHNHDMIPQSQSCFMKVNRCVTEGDALAINNMLSAGIRKCEIMRFFAEICGGNARVGFTRNDLYNHRGMVGESSSPVSDFDAVLSYLTAKKEVDHGMALTTHVQDGNITRCYWADSRSRMDYSCFGDVVALDSTFKTNVYNMMMIIIVGVNHHHQTVVFGAALLHQETTEDYIWLFDNHTATMLGKFPATIVTDSDKAIRAAVRRCWPDTRHRLCIWHFQRNLHTNTHDKVAFKKLNAFIFNDDSVEQMEEVWRLFIEGHDLQDRRWYNEIYNCRQMWWQCYLRGYFWGEMRSTQRCERMHRYMKGYVKPCHKLHQYLHHFDRAISDLRFKELEADYSTSQWKPTYMTMLRKFEEHAAMVYTKESFSRLQKQLQDEALYYIKNVRSGKVERIYDIAKYDDPKVNVQVFAVIGRADITCSCLHFETQGFPCGHILHIAKVEGYRHIPENAIMKRWTKNAKSCPVGDAEVESLHGLSIEDNRQGALNAVSGMLCYLGSRSESTYNIVSEAFSKLTIQLQNLSVDDSHEVDEYCRQRKRKALSLKADLPYKDFGISPIKVNIPTRATGNVSESLSDNSQKNDEGMLDDVSSEARIIC